MSLLIKALANAEKNKQAEQSKKLEVEHVAALSLTPVGGKPTAAKTLTEQHEAKSEFGLAVDAFADNDLSLEEEAGLDTPSMAVNQYTNPKQGVDKVTQATETNQKAAAKAFVANQSVKTPSSKPALVLSGVAGALMIWLGLQGYTYARSLAEPDVVAVKPVMPIQTQVTTPAKNAVATPTDLATLSQDTQVATTNALTEIFSAQVPSNASNQTSINQPSNQTTVPNNKVVKKTSADEAVDEGEHQAEVEANANIFVAENAMPKKSRTKKSKDNNDESLADGAAPIRNTLQNTSKQAPLKLISKTPSADVDPTLLSAYQAFSRGEDTAAQQQYRQVLQHDVRNVDALLGMAAIAQRQGRDADAAGWYQKVLEIEPRNTIAQSAIISPQVNTDAAGTESRIKNMLAQQPEAANLHAALGNLYAEQNQWPPAQEAYFNASRFAPNNADYMFNLAISLDQLGKTNLALKQYQLALDLLNKSGASSPDRAQLEARIQALQ